MFVCGYEYLREATQPHCLVVEYDKPHVCM